MARSACAAALRAAAFIALAALLAHASPAPRECCGDGSCALECTEGCAAAGCAACCCYGVTCPSTQCTDAGTCSGAGICSTETDKAAGATCTITSAGDGMCDGAGACAPAAPAGSWVAVSEGEAFGCGVDSAQRAWCWGRNIHGALGQGLLGRRRSLAQVLPDEYELKLPALVKGAQQSFSSITAGFEHVCALTPAGAAHCWGFNDAGQLGDGTQEDAGTPVAVLTVGAPAAWSKIAAGAKHTCAISADAARQPGSVWCWGDNTGGALGVAAAPPLFSSTPVLTGVVSATDVAAGGAFSCAVVAGDVECWGANSFGQLGSTSDGSAHPAPQAVALAGGGALAGAAHVTAGADFACAWAASGASAWCWGNDQSGELGNGGTDSSAAGAVPVTNPGGGAWAQLAAHFMHACGLGADGAAYCWGADALVGAGDPPPVDTTRPVAVAAAAPIARTWARLSTGCTAAATVAVAGAAGGATIYGWGLVDSYQLGNGAAAVASLPFALFPVRAGVPPCTGVACAGAQACDAETGACA